MNKKVIVIGYVWPEPNSSAAGRRMMQLIDFFKVNNYEIHFATPCSRTEHAYPLEKIGVFTQDIEVNDSSFDNYISKLKPDIVLFDRYMMEEQFSWRVQDQCPDAITILDTEDLHSLRKRRKSELNSKPSSKNDELELRELASIYRSDLSLIISKYEVDYLIKKGISNAQLLYLPFMEESIKGIKFNRIEEREHFVTIGSFLHDPNVDSIRYLKQSIWPLIRRKMPNAEMHIYGSYPSSKVEQLTNLREGFIIKGWAEDVSEVMKSSKVCLSPLRFGAGLKGKFIDAMKNGTPIVTTSIGAEGMSKEEEWPGYISDDPNEIANKAVKLYSDKKNWLEKQNLGIKVIEEEFSKSKFHQIFKSILFELKAQLFQHRKANTVGQILKLNTLRSTKFMSKWIEEKNKD